MGIIIRIAAGIVVALVVGAAGCSAMLSGATGDAIGVLEESGVEVSVAGAPPG